MEVNWNPWISCAEDSPAKTSRKPESRPASRDLAAVFGLNSPVSLGWLDLDGCWLRTYQGSLFREQCDEWSENWPDSGMWASGEVYELQNSAPVTCENESSLWPTAQASDVFGTRQGSPDWSSQGLNIAATVWRTPDTPGVGGPRNRQNSINQGHQITIAEQAERWMTPIARDWKSETGSENNSYNKTPNLSRQVYRLSHPAPVIPDGPQSSENVQTSRRRLNPRFVEWLMGFPLTWTEL